MLFRVKTISLLMLLFGGVVFAGANAATNSIVWQTAGDEVSADVHGEALWPLLTDIAHQTGWHIFVEPGIDRKADVKFANLTSGEALKKLLGDLNFAFVPKTNEADHLYVFATTVRAATQCVNVAATTNKMTAARHVANELILKVKPGTDIDALAKSLGAKVIGRDDKLGIYRLQFGDVAATDAALGQLQFNPAVAAVEYNYILDPPPAPQQIANAPTGPVSLTLNPPGDSGHVIVGLIDTPIQPLGSSLDPFILKQISITGDTVDLSSTDPTHATSMAETILRAMAAQGGSTSAEILPVDVYGNSETATTWNVALGVQAAVDGGATVLNMSLGGTSDSAILSDVIQQAEAKGIVIFAAAGNQPVTTPTYPAADSGVIAVAATQGNQLASYSNYGSFIALALPGASVVYLGGAAWVVQGTSPATAYATGIAAGAKSGTSQTWGQILSTMQQKFPVPQK
jgi:thermitase